MQMYSQGEEKPEEILTWPENVRNELNFLFYLNHEYSIRSIRWTDSKWSLIVQLLSFCGQQLVLNKIFKFFTIKLDDTRDGRHLSLPL